MTKFHTRETQPWPKLVVCAALALAMSLTACGESAYLTPAKWAPEVKQNFPAGSIILTAGLKSRGNGVVIHSCAAHGTYALTNEHIAQSLATSVAHLATVPRQDPSHQEPLATFHMKPFLPDRQTLKERKLIREASSSGTAQTPLETLQLIEAFIASLSEDLGVVKLETNGERLPCAPLAALGTSVAPEELKVVSIPPQRAPHFISVAELPHTAPLVVASQPARKGQSGSGIFDAQGRVHALVAWVLRDASELEGLAGSLKELTRTYDTWRAENADTPSFWNGEESRAEVEVRVERLIARLQGLSAAIQEREGNTVIGITALPTIHAWFARHQAEWLLDCSCEAAVPERSASANPRSLRPSVPRLGFNAPSQRGGDANPGQHPVRSP